MGRSEVIRFGGWFGATAGTLAVLVLQPWHETRGDVEAREYWAQTTVGRPGPTFDLADEGERRYGLSMFHGRPILLFFLCGCQPCEEAADALRGLDRAPAEDLAILGITSLGPGDARRFRRRTSFPFPVLLDGGGQTALAYGVAHCPAFWLLDRQGVARGIVRFDPGGEDASEQFLSRLKVAVEAIETARAPRPGEEEIG